MGQILCVIKVPFCKSGHIFTVLYILFGGHVLFDRSPCVHVYVLRHQNTFIRYLWYTVVDLEISEGVSDSTQLQPSYKSKTKKKKGHNLL